MTKSSHPNYELDAELPIEDISLSLIEMQELLEPYGMGNSQPIFATRMVTPVAAPRVLKDKHLRLDFRAGRRLVQAIYFRGAEENCPVPLGTSPSPLSAMNSMAGWTPKCKSLPFAQQFAGPETDLSRKFEYRPQECEAVLPANCHMKSSMLAPETPLADMNWIPRNRLTPLARLGLSTLCDLIEHYPRRYEDRHRFDRFPDEEMDRPVCLFGVATKTSLKRLGGWRRMFEITCENQSGGILSQPLTCRWFNMPYIQKMIAVGQRLVIFGRPKKRGRQIVIDHPEFETVEDDEEISIHMNRIAPVHPAGDGVSPRLLRTLIFQALDQADLEAFPNLLPASKADALRNIHFPATFQQLEVARRIWFSRNFLPSSSLSTRGGPTGEGFRAPQKTRTVACSTGCYRPCRIL